MEFCTFDIRLKPRAKRDKIEVNNDGNLSVSVTSPPVDNKANDHMMKILAKNLGLPKRAVRIIKGAHNRQKSVALEGITEEQVLCRLKESK